MLSYMITGHLGCQFQKFFANLNELVPRMLHLQFDLKCPSVFFDKSFKNYIIHVYGHSSHLECWFPIFFANLEALVAIMLSIGKLVTTCRSDSEKKSFE